MNSKGLATKWEHRAPRVSNTSCPARFQRDACVALERNKAVIRNDRWYEVLIKSSSRL